MENQKPSNAAEKRALYDDLLTQLRALTEDERDAVANLANASALLYGALPDVNWVGFYRLRGDTLVLGPFQGKPACIRIPLSRGVCGAAARENKPYVVPDVHLFPGHIACDCASRSEIVVPLRRAGRVVGVLDIDSPLFDRFDARDEAGLRALTALLEDACDFTE